MANGEYGDIGLRVRQRREELGLTREKMAERAGLSVQFMASVELGKQSMTLTPPWSRSARNSAPMRNKCCAHLFRPYSPKGNIFIRSSIAFFAHSVNKPAIFLHNSHN